MEILTLEVLNDHRVVFPFSEIMKRSEFRCSVTPSLELHSSCCEGFVLS